jgi:hypothetical protein
VLFASGAIKFNEGNNMLSALVKYVINRLIHGLFHIAQYNIHSNGNKKSNDEINSKE